MFIGYIWRIVYSGGKKEVLESFQTHIYSQCRQRLLWSSGDQKKKRLAAAIRNRWISYSSKIAKKLFKCTLLSITTFCPKIILIWGLKNWGFFSKMGFLKMWILSKMGCEFSEKWFFGQKSEFLLQCEFHMQDSKQVLDSWLQPRSEPEVDFECFLLILVTSVSGQSVSKPEVASEG